MPKTMLLPVPLTDTEKLVLLDDLSAMITEHESLEEQRKALPDKIKNLEASLHVKNHAKKNGYVERDIEIREEPNAFAAKVKIFRVDTNEFVKERDMDPEEAQMQLGNSSVPGPTPNNVRSLAEARARTEEQNTAKTPEEAEEQRNQRLAVEAAQRVEDLIGGLQVAIEARGEGQYVASIEGGIPGLAGSHAGPIRDTPEKAKDELIEEVRRLVTGAGGVPAPAEPEDPARAAEIAALAEQQAADDAKDKPKKLLRAPRGHKGKKSAPPADPDAPDLTPTPGAAF